MPALGEVDYTLVRPLMSGQQRLMNQEQIRTSQDTRREAMRQRAITERNYQQGQVMLRDIKASALRNKKPDGTIDYERFIGDLYSINPELATKVQGAQSRQGLLGPNKLSVYEQRRGDLEKIRAMPEGPEKEQELNDYYNAVAGGAVFATTDESLNAAGERERKKAIGKTLGEASVDNLKAALEAKIAGAKTEATKSAELEAEKEKEKYTYKRTSAEKQEVVDIIGVIINSKALATGLDPARLSQAIPGTEGYVFAQQVKNLKNRLSLEGRQKLKGQGQISDYEGKMLANSVSILDLNLPRDAFIAELNRINDVLAGKYRLKEDKPQEEVDPLGIR